MFDLGTPIPVLTDLEAVKETPIMPSDKETPDESTQTYHYSSAQVCYPKIEDYLNPE